MGARHDISATGRQGGSSNDEGRRRSLFSRHHPVFSIRHPGEGRDLAGAL
jgi:hypothetical protein